MYIIFMKFRKLLPLTIYVKLNRIQYTIYPILKLKKCPFSEIRSEIVLEKNRQISPVSIHEFKYYTNKLNVLSLLKMIPIHKYIQFKQ